MKYFFQIKFREFQMTSLEFQISPFLLVFQILQGSPHILIG